jgi:hypothetical protein
VPPKPGLAGHAQRSARQELDAVALDGPGQQQDVLAVGGQLEGRVARPVGQVRVGAEHDLLAGLHHEARGQGVHEGLVGIVRD